MKRLLMTSSIVALLLFSGCESDSSTNSVESSTATATSGQLVDNYIENADYICEDGTTGTTDIQGRFQCTKLPVKFYIGGLKLGEISILASDTQVFPQDLLGLSRDDLNNSAVIAMARFLQSCDEDRNPGNGIRILHQLKESLIVEADFDEDDINFYAEDANITLIDEDDTVEHLTQTTEFVDALNAVEKLPIEVRNALLTAQSTLTQEVKNTLSYMGNEERLAYDIYNKLYETSGVKQFTNIATRSEATHIAIVQLLVKKYITASTDFTNIDLPELGYKDTKLEDMEAGTYDIKVIQELYDALILKGQASNQDALEVACMVEVTDINDLLNDIALAQDSNATDVVTAFEFLRDGSYAHYWAFDAGLKTIGVVDGCCSLGTVDGVDYCHNEYPQHEKVSEF